MKKAKVVEIFSPDIDDLLTYEPDDPESFNILLQISVGIENDTKLSESGETFDVEIYTPKMASFKYEKGSDFSAAKFVNCR